MTMKSLKLRSVLCLALMAFLPTGYASTANAAAGSDPWAQVPGILKRIVPPTFPARDFDVTKYGAKNDGNTDCTQAFREAIAACTKAGGGRVVVPAGKFLTGPIHLKNNVNLHVTKDATILFSKKTSDYMPVVFTRFECMEVMNYSALIYAFEQQNIALTGEGTLDGQAGPDFWHNWRPTWRADVQKLTQMGTDGVPVKDRVFGEGHQLRPNFVQPVRCRNVLIEGVKIINSPMWVIHPVYSTNVTVRGVTVLTQGPNTDGCNPDSCTDVLIEDCHFSNDDDCIAIKSGRDHDGRRVNIPTENVIVRNCVFEAGHGGVTMGSETSGGIRNVFAENCSFDSPDLDMAMRFKTNPARGGFIENIFFRNCTIKTAKYGLHMTLRYGGNGAIEGGTIPVVRDIDIRDSTFNNLTRQPIFIQGWSPEGLITDVTIANCELNTVKPNVGNTITNAARIKLVNVKVNGAVVQ
jgi:polygalacturonase